MEEEHSITPEEKELRINDFIATRYTQTVFKLIADSKEPEVRKNRKFYIETFMENDRTVLDRYIEDDYELLKESIRSMKKICFGDKEERKLPSIDFQVDLINDCKSHKDYLYKSFRLQLSSDKKEVQEFNIEVFNDILDYFIENT
jgi:hypothetical protein